MEPKVIGNNSFRPLHDFPLVHTWRKKKHLFLFLKSLRMLRYYACCMRSDFIFSCNTRILRFDIAKNYGLIFSQSNRLPYYTKYKQIMVLARRRKLRCVLSNQIFKGYKINTKRSKSVLKKNLSKKLPFSNKKRAKDF